MEKKYLHQILPILEELDTEKRRQIEEYFITAPVWLMESFKIEHMDAGQVFVRENAKVDKVYIIVKGQIKATDYRVLGVAYDFMKFDGTYAMGGMEALMELNHYKTTLETITPCTMISIPYDKYKIWLETDIKALAREAKIVTSYLTEEARQGRIFLFLEGMQRLQYLLLKYYEAGNVDGICELSCTRQSLAEESGLCVKTINRSIRKLQEDGFIGKRGSHITIDEKQYRKIKAAMEKIIETEQAK